MLTRLAKHADGCERGSNEIPHGVGLWESNPAKIVSLASSAPQI
jgi:hypothetical protein